MGFSNKIDLMVKLYFEDEKTLGEVAEEIGCSDKTVEYHLKKNGYRLRSISESLKGRKPTEKMRECARKLGKSQVGEKNPRWKGKVKRGEYIALRKPDHPHAASDGYVMEHRLIMENALGRYLSKDEDVHHVNGKKFDNRLENLMVMKKSEHSRFHGHERISNKTHNNFIYTTSEQLKETIKQGGTVKEMAERLSMDKVTFYKKLERHNLKDWYKEWRNSSEYCKYNR